MNKKVLGVVVAALILLIGGVYFLNKDKETAEADSTEAIKITHELGTTIIEETPKNVVVLDLGALDALGELGVNIVGVPQSGTLPEYLSKYSSSEYANVGSIKEPNLEAINELKPDLIIMSGRMSDYYSEFELIAPTLYVESDGANYIESFKETLEVYGEVFNKEKEVNKMINNVTDKVEEVNKIVSDIDGKASLVMVNGRGISAYGEGSRFGLLFNEIGFEIVDDEIEASTHGQEVSFEYLVEKNPKYLFVVDRNAVTGSEEITAESVIENELTMNIDAYKNSNIVYLNSTYWYTISGGYTSTLGMIDEVLEAVK